MSSPADAGPAICFAQCVSPDGSRLSFYARDLCDGRVLPPIQEFLARRIDVRRIHFNGPASPPTTTGKSKSSMSTAPRKTSCECDRAIRTLRGR